MSEPRKLWIPGPAGKLEAVLRGASAPLAIAVVAHPHPQHGGTMHNSVIFHADRELSRSGWATLRFNFRGVEGSDGVHDEGRGELDDLGAAASWIRGVFPAPRLFLVGFSFGAHCAIRYAVSDRLVAGVIAIGLATRHYSYAEAADLRRPFAVVQGEQDELADLARVRELVRPPAQLHVIPAAGHLFNGQTRDVAATVVRAAREMLGQLQAPG